MRFGMIRCGDRFRFGGASVSVVSVKLLRLAASQRTVEEFVTSPWRAVAAAITMSRMSDGMMSAIMKNRDTTVTATAVYVGRDHPENRQHM